MGLGLFCLGCRYLLRALADLCSLRTRTVALSWASVFIDGIVWFVTGDRVSVW